MADLNTYKSKLQELTALIEKLENGNLSIDELSTMESLTRDLHERSIILKYKAFEAHAGVEVDNEEEEEIAEVIEEAINEVMEEEKEEAEPNIDFSIFDEETAEPEKEEVDIMSFEEPEPIVEPSPEVMPEPTPEPEIEEHISVTRKEEIVDDVVETKVEVTHTTESTTFLDRLNLEDNSLASQFTGGKLDTLVGAFGLNQRLRFINNLFDGSSELFSDAVKTLDSQNSKAEAAEKAEVMANEHDWDLEEENVVEFMTYLNRRYA